MQRRKIKATIGKPESEKIINYYKDFYKKYLQSINNRNEIQNVLEQYIFKLLEIGPQVSLFIEPKRTEIDRVVTKFLTQHFSVEMSNLYKKEFSQKKVKNEFPKVTQSGYKLLDLLGYWGQKIETRNDQLEKEHEYQIKFLEFINDCLLKFGLHPKISQRNPSSWKRFNLKNSPSACGGC